ncbi:hypothetical protein BBJ28_00017039 [Nothophytophthora sp. Chile5]|nr:hypothetical protein BBJ28_00017039 [Nothophytophthora sp. Chile5]
MFRVQVADGILASEVPSMQSAPPQKPRVSFAASTAPPPAPASEPPQSVPVPPEVEDEEMKEATEEPADIAFEEGKVEAPRMNSHSALQLLRDSSFDAVSRGAITTLMKIVTNILSHPDNEKLRSIRLSNAAFNRSVGQVKGGLEFLQSVGFVVVHETQILTLRSVQDCKQKLEEGLRLLYIEADDLSIARETRPVVVEEKPADPSFDVFKTQITRMQVRSAAFHPSETIQDVMNHVKECLASAYADHPFFLYVTPPTQKLAAEKTLADLNLVPAALTYLSWLEVPPQPEQAAVGFYFRPDLVSGFEITLNDGLVKWSRA